MTIKFLVRGLYLAAALSSTGVHAANEAAACKYGRVAELPLRYTGPTLQVTTDGAIDGLAGPMLVDTGAGFSSLSRTGAERRKLWLSATGSYANGIGGLSRLYSAKLGDFSIGPVKTGKIRMLVIGDTGTAPTYDAIVGAPFLLQTDMELSLAEKKMRFFIRQGCDDSSFLGYWGGDIFEIPFKRHFDDSPNPHFTVEVNGEQMEAIIDSGAQATAIMARAAKRAGLKLGAPGTMRLGDAYGIGSDIVPRWSTLADLKIGAETVRNAEIGVIETEALRDIDIVLGNDFLRAHRVLFAMSQQKLYISYVGGQPFKQRIALAPWIVEEAKAGNADAQLALASIYNNGRGVQKDARQADAWLLEAAANGSSQANVMLGLARMGEGRYQEAASHLRTALDTQAAERIGALWLYVTRLHTGQADLGKQELEAAFAYSDGDDWPRPVADFFLGRIDQAKLFKAAADDKRLARQRGCAASTFMIAMYGARGDSAQAEALRTAWRTQCTAPQPPSANSNGET